MHPKQTNFRSRGLTLIEFLVAVAIISVLIALVLPAVRSAREAAEKVQAKKDGFESVEKWKQSKQVQEEQLTAEDPKRVAQAVEQLAKNNKLLVPGWYRSRYRPDSLWVFSYNHLLQNTFFLSLFIYPFAALVVTRLNLGRDGDYFEYFFREAGWLHFLGLLVGVLVATIVVSAFIYGFLYFTIALFTPTGHYVPYDFIALLMIVLTLGLCAWHGGKLLGREGERESRSFVRPVMESSIAVPRKLRSKVIIRAVVRAAAVAIVTAIGSQIGGWIGGFLVLLLSTAVAAYLGVHIPSYEHYQE